MNDNMDKTGFIFRLYTLNRRWSNASLLVNRRFDGHIVSMQQSGSHWIKNMLSSVLIQLYGLPPMKHIQDDSVIGHTKSPPVYKNIPQIVHSHGYPHALTLKIPGAHFPKYLVLTRDLRQSLVSHYERFKGDYGNVPFATYLRGDVRQKTYHSDIWTRIRFMNEWGRVMRRHPDSVMAVHYEDLKRDAPGTLSAICKFFGIKGVTVEVIMKAVEASTREKMAEKPNPAVTTTVVRTEVAPPESYFTPADEAFFTGTVARYLKHDFGYGCLGLKKESA